MKNLIIAILTLLTMQASYSQGFETHSENALPFGDISDVPESYSAGAVAARMVAALGFRYRYATMDLQESDFDFSAEADGRSIGETMDHIYSLTVLMSNTLSDEAVEKEEGAHPMKARALTLHLLKEAYDKLLTMDEEAFQKITIRGSAPFWNWINGPLADALWHSGQIATLRRANGHPMPQGVNVFMGTYQAPN